MTRSKQLVSCLFVLSVLASVCVWIGEDTTDGPYGIISDQKLLPSTNQTLLEDVPNPCSISFDDRSDPPSALDQCCQRLYRGDRTAVGAASTIHVPPNDTELLDDLESCDGFFERHPSYSQRMNDAPTDDDSPPRFSIAYSILAHRDLQHVERLLRTIYRPEHYYCLHADHKSIGLEKKIRRLARCLPNVIVASRSHTVVWGGVGILRATLTCLKDLVKLSSGNRWRYFINLSAQDFPLRTNRELIAILKSWDNRSAVEIVGEAAEKKIAYSYRVKYNRFGNADSVYRTDERKPRPPYNATIVKGNLAVALSRPLAEWYATSPKAAELFSYLSNTANPDEHFWQTPLANKREFDLDDRSASLIDSYRVRYAVWKGRATEKCQGKFIRDVCVFGVGDLRGLIENRDHLFVNKLYLGYQSAAYECLSARYLTKSQLGH